MKSLKILIIATSHYKMGDTDEKTGVWLEELATPYYIFKEAGADVVLASPKGGAVPLDPKSQSIIVVTPPAKRFIKDVEAMSVLAHSVLLSEITAGDFDGVYLPGGHGPMWDITGNTTVSQLLEEFYRANKPIGSVCHGVVALLDLQNERGEPVIKGKQITAFSNSEEESARLTKIVPFLLETKLRSLGALYSKGPDYVSHVLAEGNIITGQNAASSEGVAKKMIALLQPDKHQSVNKFKSPIL